MVELRSPIPYCDLTREESGIEGFAAAFAKYGIDDVAEMASLATAFRKVNRPASESEGFDFSGAVHDGLFNLETPVFVICGEMAALAFVCEDGVEVAPAVLVDGQWRPFTSHVIPYFDEESDGGIFFDCKGGKVMFAEGLCIEAHHIVAAAIPFSR